MFKHLFLLAFGFFAIFSPVAAQSECNFDVSEVQSLLSQAADTENADEVLKHITEARAALQLIEGRCLNFALETAGDSRLNPVPFGRRQKVEISDDFLGSIEIIEYIDEAESYVLDAYDGNEPAPEGTRYVVFRLKYSCEKSPAESCSFNRGDFSTVGDKGVSYQYDSGDAYDISIYEINESREIFGGTEIEVAIAFLVDETDKNLVLFTEYGRPRVFFASQ